ncbi:hypothetical protein LMOSLCC2482_0629 [Listeria monocytogenes serotype 7 str. SLCC2482]|nr:hypothetical protein LMOh7858_0690 [Listeria monocytogenes str. 4b H7858] [Listeria monocytogenes serotype 4b str. H7858]CBY03150.1 hypothetical protein LMOSLCC2482_0629 [Listeria monocytogenes serotype 7 str. SLCC2482]CBY48225.1 hypothetical protein LMOSLCC2755_0633 [Listeria monocytogenes SLCC2755]CBY66713.1 hypothetical protein LMOL312_0635 [Listeria monocytogenes L312]CBY69556.1 hypothetical protein LMOATCC19117_0657 [Listeria monocytogenes ATCC 19117]CBY72418.1 hypothetical protein LMO
MSDWLVPESHFSEYDTFKKTIQVEQKKSTMSNFNN